MDLRGKEGYLFSLLKYLVNSMQFPNCAHIHVIVLGRIMRQDTELSFINCL